MSKRGRMSTGQRDAIDIASTLLRPQPIIVPIRIVHDPRTLGDNRYNDVTRSTRAPLATNRAASRIYAAKKNAVRPMGRYSAAAISHHLRFAVPSKVALCVRRNIRKEVLHALGKAGRSGKIKKRRRRTFWSDVSC